MGKLRSQGDRVLNHLMTQNTFSFTSGMGLLTCFEFFQTFFDQKFFTPIPKVFYPPSLCKGVNSFVGQVTRGGRGCKHLLRVEGGVKNVWNGRKKLLTLEKKCMFEKNVN